LVNTKCPAYIFYPGN